MSDLDIPEEDGHRVVATARGVFDSSGGVLESKETGRCIDVKRPREWDMWSTWCSNMCGHVKSNCCYS